MSATFQETAYQMILNAAFSAFGYPQEEEAVYTSAADMESNFRDAEVTAVAANEPQHNISSSSSDLPGIYLNEDLL